MIRKFLSVVLLCLPLWACAEEAPTAPAADYAEGIDYAAVIPPLCYAKPALARSRLVSWLKVAPRSVLSGRILYRPAGTMSRLRSMARR